ncbi:hypothetical protein [Mesobacillus selenatarsenatis]|uniref:Uncharacterized protein n=1 Tax=Mesobacillus selenatarsenatis TaxID=388741 RepID=A0A846TCZ8_9BACI|nr:hypothetical protein [Mesobacillus selenatarsenatis]NKE04689.1 hypothetical protein [Mesobacillus selenatarsenatis]
MKKWKIVLAVISVVLLAGAGTLYYLLEVKTYETQDELVEDVVAEEYDIALPGEEGSEDSAAEENGDGIASGDSTDENTSAGSTTKDSGDAASKETTEASTTSSTASTKTAAGSKSQPATSTDKKVSSQAGATESSSNKGSSKPKPTAEQIAAKYEPSFLELEAQANEKIDALVGHAIGEYVAKKKNGEEVSYFYFYSKYNTAGKILERNTDGAFNYVYKALVKELKDNGYNSSAAQQYKTAYETAKKQRRAALINKAKAAL